MPKPDMSLAVNVQVTGTIDNQGALTATATYTQGDTVPSSANVVSSTGEINLNQMNDSSNDYSNQTDITFMLSGSATDPDGNSYAIQFPSLVGDAVSINQQGGSGGNGELTPSLSSATVLQIEDADDDGQTYHYCLTVQAETISADGEPTAQLDPNIVNR